MDNQETHATLDTRHRTRTYKTKNYKKKDERHGPHRSKPGVNKDASEE